MVEVIPAILKKSYNEMKEQVASVTDFCRLVQIDFCDGKFVQSKTWPYADNALGNDPMNDEHFLKIIEEEEGMPYWENVDYELHLMVGRAHLDFDMYLKLSPKRILFQIEAEVEIDNKNSIEEFREFLEGIDVYIKDSIQIGICINPGTNIQNIIPIIPFIDYVQCMGIAVIGSQGQPFDERVFDHIKYLRENYSELIIAVDGCVNTETAPRLVDAGVSRLVIGSALLNSADIKETYFDFASL